MHLVLYSKPGCHLCEGLQEKLEQIVASQKLGVLQLEVRDITTREDWFEAFQFEIPVLCRLQTLDQKTVEQPLPRPSPRATVAQLEQMLQKFLAIDSSK